MLALGKDLTVEQRLSKAVVDIMAKEKYVALAGILMIGDRLVKDDIPTACTNGRDEMYGRKFVDSLNDPELRYLVLHENYHKLYKHLVTWFHLWLEDPDLANKSADYVINIKISDDNRDGFAVAPKIALLDERFRDMDTAQVFNMLKKEKKGGGGGKCPPPNGGGSPQPQGNVPQGFDDHDWEGAKEFTDDEKRELDRDVDEAIRQGALIAGKLGTGTEREFQELLKPQIDWHETMREFITSTCAGNDFSTYRRPNRRFIEVFTRDGIFMPSGISESIEGVVVGGDMSGSIGQREQSVIITEAKACFDTVKPEWVRMLYWGTEVVGDEKYMQDQLDDFAKTTKPRGGGGTNVECVPPYLTKHSIQPQATIIITDGEVYGGWGNWNCPVLWVIIDNEDAKPDVGTVIHVSSSEL